LPGPLGISTLLTGGALVRAFLEPYTDFRDLRFQLVSELLSALPIDARCRSPVHHSQVSLRNSGVSKCANEVNRAL